MQRNYLFKIFYKKLKTLDLSQNKKGKTHATNKKRTMFYYETDKHKK